MSRMVAIEDLLDAHGVAELLGLAHPNTVSVYQHRYDDMPGPVIDLGRGRVKMWLQPEIEHWRAGRSASSDRRGRSPDS